MTLVLTNLLKIFFCVAIVAVSAGIRAIPQRPLGIFAGDADIGKVKNPGSARYDAEKQEYALAGSGANMWFDHDELHWAWKSMKGDFILTATARFVGQGVEPHRKLGWIIRSGLDSDSPHVGAEVHGDGLTSLQFRRTKGGPTEEVKLSVTAADVIQLERKGQTYKMSAARFGEPFETAGVSDVAFGDDVFVGLFVCSHNPDVVEKAVFRNVRVTVPARDSFAPYRDYIGSDLEIMDVESGHRRIVHSSPDSLQAPNWTPDGKSLIYNSKGRLYRFDLTTKTPSLIDTDFATTNNNDHVLSFDGKMIGISNQASDDQNRSNIYTVPIQGGKPRRVTSIGPSYLHGWSPDGKYLVFTGGRNGNLDIYKIPSEGGPEQRLTTYKGLDDGPEYSPDGNYIYFNSSRSGLMQIWRMKPDGSSQQQITDDDYNNWFPHVSPDGKWIVLLSFMKDVAPDDHPFYKHVYLRSMPAGGGNPKVIAYLYGGQGTINVPSWSPDSKRIAFISNTDKK